jgi:hypothetical protein
MSDLSATNSAAALPPMPDFTDTTDFADAARGFKRRCCNAGEQSANV